MKKILTIGGSDPFAGGGIQSDLKTFENYHQFGMSALTCVGMLNNEGDFILQNVSPEWLEQQLVSIDQMVNLDGIKIGLLNSMAAIDVVTEFVKKKTDIPIVLDPVLAFKETDDLAQDTYSKHLVDHLFPLADVVTPNLKEAALLTGKNDSFQLEEIRKMAKEIYSFGSRSVIVKGGAGVFGEDAVDVLYSEVGFESFHLKKRPSITVNGAGCTFSSAITANLANGTSLSKSVANSKKYVYQCIINGVMMNDGTGSVWSGGEMKEDDWIDY